MGLNPDNLNCRVLALIFYIILFDFRAMIALGLMLNSYHIKGDGTTEMIKS